jgi:hypothetical protein
MVTTVDSPPPPPPPADVSTGSIEEPEDSNTGTATIPRRKLFIEKDTDLEDEVNNTDSCRVQQPPREIVFRVRKGKEWRAEALIVDFRLEDSRVMRGKYLITGDMIPKFKGFGRRVHLVTCISSTGAVFLWDIKVTIGFGDTWYKSDLAIASKAEEEWTRFTGSDGAAHTSKKSKKNYGEPKWPEDITEIYDLALIAFPEERMVETLSHPLCDVYDIE